MIEIILKDGSTKKYEKGISAFNIAKDISEGLARNVLSAKFNGTAGYEDASTTSDSTTTIWS